ncbi:MAG: FHA domain-containing protein [Candidatus Nanopelagicales bacterium]
MARTCPSCGRGAEDEDRFCRDCGWPLTSESAEDAAELTGTLAALQSTLGTSGPLLAVGTGLVDGLAPGSALLLVRRGPGEGAHYTLEGDVVTVGRTPESTIFLDDVTVSRRHAEFRQDSAGWSVHDVGSLNGTYVNRDRVDDARLAGGDEVQVGKYRFVFLVGEPQEERGS